MTTIQTSDLIEIICDALGIETEAAKPEANLEQLGIDSLGRNELAMDIEENFNVGHIKPVDMEECKTVQDILSLVERRLQ